MAETLRYPYAMIDANTDYLQIEVIEYQPLGITAAENVASQGLASAKTQGYTSENVEATIFLPIPQNIQDSNGTGWGEDRLNALGAYALGAAEGVITSSNFFQGLADAIKTATGTVTDLATSGEGNKLTNTFLLQRQQI